MEKFFRFFLLTCVVSASPAAVAHNWANPILTCTDARFEEICWESRSTRQCRNQVILTSEHAQNHFIYNRMAYPNSENEIILLDVQKIANSTDYKDESTALENPGRVHYIKPGFDGPKTFTVETFETSPVNDVAYLQNQLIGSYIFRGCR